MSRLVPSWSERGAMTLADLRRLCIRRQLRVTFIDAGGKRCSINEHGATLRDGVAGWLQSEEDFSRASVFEVLGRGESKPRMIDRTGLSRLHSEGTEVAGKRRTLGKRLSLIQFQQ